MKDELKRERRRQNALERLSSDDPRCVCCGEADWRCLEVHHLAGRAYCEEGTIVCRNCHRKLSDKQRDHPPSLTKSDAPSLEQIGHFLLGLADLFELLVSILRGYGGILTDAAAICPRPYGHPSVDEDTA